MNESITFSTSTDNQYEDLVGFCEYCFQPVGECASYCPDYDGSDLNGECCTGDSCEF